MLKKLEVKNLISYKKYSGAQLTIDGSKVALNLIRKHRLWEVFLLEKLNFKWDEVHEIAEHLEHIKSRELTDRLDEFLGYPKFDPHGDPIPDKNGIITDNRKTCLLSELAVGEKGILTGVNDSSSVFLKYLERIDLTLGKNICVREKLEYDGSYVITLNKKEVSISQLVAGNIIIKPTR